MQSTHASAPPWPGPSSMTHGAPASGEFSSQVAVTAAPVALANRWRPCTSQEDEATIMLTEYTVQDESIMSAVGSHSKALSWTIEGGGRSTPVRISVQIEKTVMGKAELLVREGDSNLFPIGSGSSKASLTEDFVQRWNFCGRAAGLHEHHFYEVQVAAADNQVDEDSADVPPQSTWRPATLTRQLDDGSFEVMASVPDGRGGLREVVCSPVGGADLREVRTRKRIHVPWRYAKLTIPKHNPLEVSVVADHGEPILSFLAMPTPPAVGLDAEVASTVTINVDRTRSFIESDITAAAFDHFMSGEVRRGHLQEERWMKTWALQLGPFAEHAVTIEKGDHSGCLQVTVDGKCLLQASAQELHCEGALWSCNFRFVGKRYLEFLVYETNKNAAVLDSQGTVVQESSVEHTCSLTVPNTFDLSGAVLKIDGLEFQRLPTKVPTEGGSHRMALDALRQEYGIHVPYKINERHACSFQPKFLDAFAESQKMAADPEKPIHTMESSLSAWLDDLKGIWHACTMPHRIPSEDGVPSPVHDRRPPAVPPSPQYGVKATW